MRTITLSVALSSALLASACAGGQAIGKVEDWKKTALADCQKKTDLIAREQCREQVMTVSLERVATEDNKGKKR
jgi:hypothetical protein